MSTAISMPKPLATLIRDCKDRQICIFDAKIGFSAACSSYAPRFQDVALGGGPVTIHFDHSTERIQVSPLFMKEELDKTQTHIADLPQRVISEDEHACDEEGPEYEENDEISDNETQNFSVDVMQGLTFQHSTPQGQFPVDATPQAPQGNFDTAVMYGQLSIPTIPGSSFKTHFQQSHALNVNEKLHRRQSASSKSRDHIKRPRNQWIIYRSEKSKELHMSNPGMSAGEISTEVSRQWKLEPQEVKAYYQEMADEEARQHKMTYPGYKYRPGKQ